MSASSPSSQAAKATGVILVLAATFGLALKGIWARFAYAEGLGVSGVLFYRSALSVPFVIGGAVWLLRRARSESGDGAVKSYSWRDYAPGAALGAMFSVGMMCDFEAIARLGASVSRVVLFGFPLVVLVLDAVARRTLPETRRVLGFAIAWMGLFFVARKAGPISAAGDDSQLTPLAWGVASMVFYAVYVWLSGKIANSLGSVRLTSVSNLATAAVVVTVVLIQGAGAPPQASAAALGWIVVMVFVSTVAPYFMLMEGIRRLGAPEASLLAMTGPVITVGAGWLLLGEQMTLMQLAGTAGTMVGVGVARG
jgi:drug/metabolite transporter (DMT)-like permease